jgi:glycosyltransferase involved in cell wall biosynthesis
LVSALDPSEIRSVLAVSCGREAAFRTEDVARWQAQGRSVHEVPMGRGIVLTRDLASLVALVRVIRRERPDVIHAHSSKAGFLARLAGAWCRVPVVYTPHVFPFLMRCGERARRCYWLLERSVRGLTTAVIAVSREEADEAARLGYAADRVFQIPNGVAPCANDGVVVRERVPLRIGLFGRLSPQKGVDVLLAAIPEIVAHVPHVHISLFGEGDLRDALRAQAEALQIGPWVTFEGLCAQGRVLERMREMDVIVVPSRWEGCPYVVLDAWQAGVPVVASSVGGVSDLIRSGENGVLVPPDDPEALCAAVLRLLREPLRRKQLAEAGRHAAERHTLNAMAAAVAGVYRFAAGLK